MNQTFFYELWPEPLVCVITAGASLRRGVELALAHARGRDCHILVRASWDLEIIGFEIVEAAARLAASHPNVTLTSLAPTRADAAMMAVHGVRSLHASNAAFVDERIYAPSSAAAKAFDAIHNAQTGEFKRHELALGVPRLALVTYDEAGSAEKVAALAGRYRDLRFVNWTRAGGHYYLNGSEVSHLIGQACCGLALSEIEGPNNAIMEYRMCGTPLVTTPSRGGRDALNDPDFVTVVAPRAEAVEAGVAAWSRRPADPWAVRAAALARVRPHRARLIAWLSAIVGRDLMVDADENLWLPSFHDKLRQLWRYAIDADGALTMERADI